MAGIVVRNLFLRGRRGGPWALPSLLRGEQVWLSGNLGARLAALWFPRPDARGVVVLAHPDRRYGKHWFVREGWVEWLLTHGFEVLIFDLAAYGQSSGGSTYFHDDVRAAVAEAVRRRPGLPLHIIGLSMGAFATLNAGPRLPPLESVVLESPYPSFEAWYEGGGRRGAKSQSGRRRLNAALKRVWPRTYRRIDAARNAADLPAKRILVTASAADQVTPVALSRAVLHALPPHARYLEAAHAEHLQLFHDPAYRDAVLATLKGT